MRTPRSLPGLALATALTTALTTALLVGCGEQGAPDVTVREAAASGSPTSTPSPTPPPASPTTSAPGAPATAIPDDLSVEHHLPEDGGDFRWHERGVSAELCGREAFPVGDLADRRTASVTGPEYGEGRDLRLFRDVTAAETFVADVADHVRGCPGTEQAGSESVNDLVRSTLDGDESFTVVQTYLQDGLPTLGANFWEVVRVGAAVLLTVSYGEYDPQHNLDQGIRDHAGDVTAIVEQMCVFASSPCPTSPR